MWWIVLKKHRNVFTFYIIRGHWDGSGSWNTSSWTMRNHLSYIGWWWPGKTRIQGISSLSIDPVIPEYSSLSTNRDRYDIVTWKCFPRYWPFVRGIHQSLVDFPPWDRLKILCNVANTNPFGAMERFSKHAQTLFTSCVLGVMYFLKGWWNYLEGISRHQHVYSLKCLAMAFARVPHNSVIHANMINTMSADDLNTTVARASVDMILIIKNRYLLVIIVDEFQQLPQFQYWLIIQNAHISSNNSMCKWLIMWHHVILWTLPLAKKLFL